MPRKKDLIEDLSNAIIDQNALVYETEYRQHINAIQVVAIEQILDGKRPTQKSLKKGLRVIGVNRATRNAWLIGNVTLLVQNPKIKGLESVKDLMKIYSVSNPKLFSSKIDRIVKKSLGIKVTLNPRELRAYKIINPFLTENKEVIQKLINQNTIEMRRINKSITTNTSRNIIKRRNKLIKDRVTIEGVTRPLTNEEIGKQLEKEFRVDKPRVRRIVETESHRQNELVKEVTAKAQGMTKKKWNTQRDSKVRDTHMKLNGITIGINKDFNVGGHKASFPGDPRLPPEESINCRCFLTFE